VSEFVSEWEGLLGWLAVWLAGFFLAAGRHRTADGSTHSLTHSQSLTVTHSQSLTVECSVVPSFVRSFARSFLPSSFDRSFVCSFLPSFLPSFLRSFVSFRCGLRFAVIPFHSWNLRSSVRPFVVFVVRSNSRQSRVEQVWFHRKSAIRSVRSFIVLLLHSFHVSRAYDFVMFVAVCARRQCWCS